MGVESSTLGGPVGISDWLAMEHAEHGPGEWCWDCAMEYPEGEYRLIYFAGSWEDNYSEDSMP